MAGAAHLPTTRTLVVCALLVVALGGPVYADEPEGRTADMPDSWLVLYNLNSLESVTWAAWYRQQWDIPASHLLGLNASLDEHLPDLAAVQAEIITPVRDFLAGDPALEQTVMGILLGYDLPGHYDRPPLNPNIGGFSVTDALQDIHDDWKAPALQKAGNMDNPHYFGNVLPPDGRLTKGTGGPSDMLAGKYMVARIDGPTLADAMALTQRAKVFAEPFFSMFGHNVWYDYYDPAFPSSNNEWYWMEVALGASELQDLPWAEFDLNDPGRDTGITDDAFQFSIYKVCGWSPSDFDNIDPGCRVVAFDFNSFGAVTVRSTTDECGLFVPNALAAGYAAAIGATGEPQCCVGPFPDTLLASLAEGWTLGEAFYLANPFDDWMWTIVGDPFLRVPNWFDDVQPLAGDINLDGRVNLRDQAGLSACLSGPGVVYNPICATFDMDTDGDLDLADVAAFQRAFTGEPVEPATGDFDNDQDVDLVDFASLVNCQTRPEPTLLDTACGNVFDFDFDLDVDLADFGRFQVLLD